MISIKGLNKFFNKGRQNQIHVINNVSLELPEKGMVAIFGPSGCGKTTLLNVIGGLDRFAGGSLCIDGKNIRRGTDLIRNQYVGYIFQNYNLNKSESCFDNVANALRLCGIKDQSVINERVMAALSNVGMDKYYKRTPDTLSGGQQQRIAIARAIVKNPKIILADEPTGNLDEANTVMIMDLLKAISKDHLVLLVTHEAELVDYYCDKVIELRDGRVVGIKDNDGADGLAVRDKNAIYLGELNRTEMADGNATVEYYGDAPKTPVKLTVVNNGGKLYVKISTPKVQILDEFSEVKLLEGVFEKKAAREKSQQSFDMSALPPIEGKKYGRLFSLWSSIKSGYLANFKSGRRGKKVLRACMCLFSAVLVLMSAVFGTAFDKLLTAGKAYNHNVFYAYTPDAEISRRILDAVGDSESAIDSVHLYYGKPSGDNSISFYPGNFETFSTGSYASGLSTNAVYLSTAAAAELEAVAGSKEDLSSRHILLSTQVADELIENSSLGYISDYDDLVGLLCDSIYVNGKAACVAGIVDADEPAVYLSPVALATRINEESHLRVGAASNYGVTVADGEAIYIAVNKDIGDGAYYNGDGKVKIQGKELTVNQVYNLFAGQNYDEWLRSTYPDKYIGETEYFSKLVVEKYPDITEGQIPDKIYELFNEHYFEYRELYYAEFDNYLRQLSMFDSSIYIWLYLEKDIVEAKYFLMGDGKVIREADIFKAKYGYYPTYEVAIDSIGKDGVDIEQKVYEYENMYISEFYSVSKPYIYENVFLVSDNDYFELSARVGESDPEATRVRYIYDYSFSLEDLFFGGSSSDMTADKMIYSVIHSSNPWKTSRWIKENLADVSAPGGLPQTVTPTDIFGEIIGDSLKDIIVSVITLGVVLLILSICMYFIMRSSLMNRIKEVGIYRAIGVSKKNLIFKFTVESAVLTTLTVVVGYIISSIFVGVCLGISPLVESVFFYPLWFALIILVLLYAMCIVLGALPIIMLLRKTPSAILAKYDI